MCHAATKKDIWSSGLRWGRDIYRCPGRLPQVFLQPLQISSLFMFYLVLLHTSQEMVLTIGD